MGIFWKTMPFLSTLAALVIIVNSAEEDFDRDYRYELRPRVLDTDSPSHDQPWRALEVDSIIQPSSTIEVRDFEEPKRRRQVRKRKRRPPPPSSDELISEERYYSEEPRYSESEYKSEYKSSDITESPRGRRRKPDSRRNRWGEEYGDFDRPLRRRGPARKRPQDTWTEISDYPLGPNYESRESEKPVGNERNNNNDNKGRYYVDSEVYTPLESGKISDKINYDDTNIDKPLYENDQHDDSIKPAHNDNQDGYENIEAKEIFESDSGKIDQDKIKDDDFKGTADNFEISQSPVELKEDKSLSDFSSEVMDTHPTSAADIVTTQKAIIIEEHSNTPNYISPMILKEILKKSNGSSLSESLQKHNLSLADLLHGKLNPDSLLHLKKILDKTQGNHNTHVRNKAADVKDKKEVKIEEPTTEIDEKKQVTSSKPITEEQIKTETLVTNENATVAPKRRFSPIRRKLRIRPVFNGTLKSQLNRDLMALTARKYLHHSRNASKSEEWKHVISSMPTFTTTENIKNTVAMTTTLAPADTTILDPTELMIPTTVVIDIQTNNDNNDEIITTEIPQTTTNLETTTEIVVITEKSKISRQYRPNTNRLGQRRQAFNNRLKKKRMRQKNSTTEVPQDSVMKDLFGMANLVSSSEFIARTQTPKQTSNTEDFTALDDFLTTEANKIETIVNNVAAAVVSSTTPLITTTEDNAKIEIDEILNDTRTSARLSKILKERNMTLSELVEHRERGSSHVHLADIFHNASKEPNPPEPFLSKSSIEPISKETYPLRALLDANHHDGKAITIEPNPQTYMNIPVVMDFGNNVNENGENMGIMSLFNTFSSSDTEAKSTIAKDSEGTPYVTTVINVNVTANDSSRESRVLKASEGDNKEQHVVGWNELFKIMRKVQGNQTEDVEVDMMKDTEGIQKSDSMYDGDDSESVIVVEDIQHLKDFDNNIAGTSDEKIEVDSSDKDTKEINDTTEPPTQQFVANSRSVTAATGSIVGLSMILFLFTYALFKWRQQRKMVRQKQNLAEEQIPTPVFENRKGNKNNCSTRSISPMLSTPNIYTLNTMDTRNGDESPDYMWDSLRKPFQ